MFTRFPGTEPLHPVPAKGQRGQAIAAWPPAPGHWPLTEGRVLPGPWRSDRWSLRRLSAGQVAEVQAWEPAL